MTFSASSADLLRALTTVSGALSGKPTMPILESILFERDGDSLRLSATDLEISIVQAVTVDFEGDDGPSRIAVPARRLLDTLRALPDLPLTFQAADDFGITIRTDQGRYKMAGFDGGDYPEIPTVEAEHPVQTRGEIVKRAIQKAGFAVSRDALRPAMMGIYFQIGGENGRAVATDGHRLVRLTLDELTAPVQTDFIVPEKALSLTARVASDGPCALSVSGGYVGFTFEHARVVARMIEESYPNYEAVIPMENDRTATVNRQSLLAAVKRVGLYASATLKQLRLTLSADQIEVAAEDVDRSSEAKETVLADYSGESMTIGFNADYLNEVLSNVDAEDVTIALSSPNRAAIVTPSDQAEGEDLLMLIMPVMLNTYA
jgi:DNA polymerase-3 subunit beta